MLQNIKLPIKKFLAFLGLRNPALGIKMGLEGKVAFILKNKTPELNVFVETGTEFGTMIERVGDKFREVYTIELDKELYERAKKLFAGKEHIKFLHGDSATEIQKVLAELNEPALFWLDAHGPGAMSIKNPLHCPVERELEAIFNHSIKNHVVIIDDVRHFDSDTISAIRNIAKKNGFAAEVINGLFLLHGK